MLGCTYLDLLLFLLFKATPTIVEEAFIFYLWTFFLQRTDTAARRRSGAPVSYTHLTLPTIYSV